MANATASNWKPYSFHFRQKYEQGYRYLDTCGEFMVQAESSIGFIAGNAQPTGAKMDHPDFGIHLELDANGLAMSQELAIDEGAAFLETVLATASLAQAMVRPAQIYYAGFATKYFVQFDTEEQVFAASLRFGSTFHRDLADSLSMTPLLKGLNYSFKSGSYELQVDLKAVAFNSIRRDSQRGYGFRSSATQRRNIDRMNARESNQTMPGGYAMFLEVDLQEQNPPQGALDQQFKALQKYVEVLKHGLMLKP